MIRVALLTAWAVVLLTTLALLVARDEILGFGPPVVAVYDRFERRPDCAPPQVSEIAALQLRPVIAEGRVGGLSGLQLMVAGRPSPLSAAIVDPPDGFYRFPGVMGKVWHEEQLRFTCWLGWCQGNFLFYPSLMDLPTGSVPYELRLIDRRGRVAAAGTFQAETPPPAPGPATAPPALALRLTSDGLQAEVAAQPGDAHHVVLYQWRDAAGRWGERLHEIDPSALAPGATLSLPPEPLPAGATYAAALVSAERADGRIRVENKIVLRDATDPLFACGDDGAPAALGASPPG